MNAKEKAKEIVDKYKPYVYCYMGSGMLTNTEDETVILMNAKSCALICVDELILSTTPDNNPRPKNRMDREYWIEVKQEIQNL